jgi:hypothetical protein
MKERRVYSKRGDVEKLMERFQCGHSAVSMALSFQRDSVKARAIRSYAVNFLKCYFVI